MRIFDVIGITWQVNHCYGTHWVLRTGIVFIVHNSDSSDSSHLSDNRDSSDSIDGSDISDSSESVDIIDSSDWKLKIGYM